MSMLYAKILKDLTKAFVRADLMETGKLSSLSKFYDHLLKALHCR